MKIKTNYDDHDLYCHYSKEKIVLGEKYVSVVETDCYGAYEKTYKVEYWEEIESEEDEEVYISEEE